MAWQPDPTVLRKLAGNQEIDEADFNKLFGGLGTGSWTDFPYSLKNKLSRLDINWTEHDPAAIGIRPDDFERPARFGFDLDLGATETAPGDTLTKIVDQQEVKNVWSGVFSVTAFGAKPDGLAGSASANRTAIQQAIDAAYASSGTSRIAEVLFPSVYADQANVYRINATINVPGNILLRGHPGVSIENRTLNNDYVFAIKDVQHSNEDRNIFDGLSVLGGGGIKLDTSNRIIADIRGCVIESTANTVGIAGVQANTAGILHIRNTVFKDCVRSVETLSVQGAIDLCYFVYDFSTGSPPTIFGGVDLNNVIMTRCKTIARGAASYYNGLGMTNESIVSKCDFLIGSDGGCNLAIVGDGIIADSTFRIIGEGSGDPSIREGVFIVGHSLVCDNVIVSADEQQTGMAYAIKSDPAGDPALRVNRILGNTVSGKFTEPIIDTQPVAPGDIYDLTTDNRVMTNIAVALTGISSESEKVRDLVTDKASFLGQVISHPSFKRQIGILEQSTEDTNWFPLGHGLTEKSVAKTAVVHDIVRSPWGLIAVGAFDSRGYASPLASELVQHIALWTGNMWKSIGDENLAAGTAIYTTIEREGIVYFAGNISAAVPPFMKTEDGKVMELISDGPLANIGDTSENGGVVLAMTLFKGEIILVGAFHHTTSDVTNQAHSIIRYNVVTGLTSAIGKSQGVAPLVGGHGPVGPPADRTDYEVRAVASEGDLLVVGGTFDSLIWEGGTAAEEFRDFDDTSTTYPFLVSAFVQSRDQGWAPLAYCGFILNNDVGGADETAAVNAIAIHGSTVLIGGNFTHLRVRISAESAGVRTTYYTTLVSNYLVIFAPSDDVFETTYHEAAHTGWPELGYKVIPMWNTAPGPVMSIQKVRTDDNRFPDGVQYLISGDDFVGLLGFVGGDLSQVVYRSIKAPGSGKYRVAKDLDGITVIGGEFNEGYGKQTNVITDSVRATIGD